MGAKLLAGAPGETWANRGRRLGSWLGSWLGCWAWGGAGVATAGVTAGAVSLQMVIKGSGLGGRWGPPMDACPLWVQKQFACQSSPCRYDDEAIGSMWNRELKWQTDFQLERWLKNQSVLGNV